MPENDPRLDAFDWSLTTWEGSRREQLRRWARLSLEEILLAQEEMAELSRLFSDSRLEDQGKPSMSEAEASSASGPSAPRGNSTGGDEDAS